MGPQDGRSQEWATREIRRMLYELSVPEDILRDLGDEEPLAVVGLDSVRLISLATTWDRTHGNPLDDSAVFDGAASIGSLARAACVATTMMPVGVVRERSWVGVQVAAMGVVAPTGHGIEALWEGLLTGGAHRESVPYAAANGHEGGSVAGWSLGKPQPGRLNDLAVAAAEEALAGIEPELRPEVTLVIATTDTGGHALAAALEGENSDDAPALVGWFGEDLAQRLGMGEAYTVASASASGGVALGLAQDLLLAGDATQVLVLGVDTITETAFSGLAGLRTLHRGGCRPFSSERRGIGLSESASAILLRMPSGDGAGRGLGTLAGYGSSGRTTHLAAPEAEGIVLAVQRALDDAGLTPGEISFVNAHGPGTRRGDLAEITALEQVFGDRLASLPINSVKGVLWHCQGNAGVIESQACLLSLAHATLTPTHGCEPIDPAWAGLDIVTRERLLPNARHALSISCGLGGVNTAVIWSAHE